jgi:DNA-binding winged helix-turn-helix (wHTH) protein
VTIRILADREPYASFAFSPQQGPLPGSFEISGGPSALDEADADIIVIPATEFLALPRDCPGRTRFVAYGPVALMDKAFEGGCADYLREPWALPELFARLKRLQTLKFRVGDSRLSLVGSAIRSKMAAVELCPSELELFRLLLRNAPFLVTKEAGFAALSLSVFDESHALGRCAVALRHSLDSVEPGLGRRLHAVRGRGYRFDAELCG